MQKRNHQLIIFFLFLIIAIGAYLYFNFLAEQSQETAVEAATSSTLDAIKGKPKDIQEKITGADALSERLIQAIEQDDYTVYSSCFSDKIPEENKPTKEKFARLRAKLLEKGGKYLGKKIVQANYMPPVRLSYHGNFEKNAYANLMIIETQGEKSDQKALDFSISFYEPEKIKSATALSKTMLSALNNGDANTFKNHLDRETQTYYSKQVFDQLQTILKDGAPADYNAADIGQKLVNVEEKNNGTVYYYYDQTSTGKFYLSLGISHENPTKVSVWKIYALPNSALKQIDQVTDDFLNGICKNNPELFRKHLAPQVIKSPNLENDFLLMRKQLNATAYLEKYCEYFYFQEKGLILQYNVLFPGQEEYSKLTVLVEFDKENKKIYIAGFNLMHYLGNIYDKR